MIARLWIRLLFVAGATWSLRRARIARVMRHLRLTDDELESVLELAGTTDGGGGFVRRVARIAFVLGVIVGRRTKGKRPAVRLELVAGPVTEQILPSPPPTRSSSMQLLTTTQQVTLSIVPKDRKGNPASVDGVPAWTNSNPEVATIEPSEDGMSAVVKAGVPGDTTISVTADADLGDGVTEIAGVGEIKVVPSAASTVELVAGEVTEQE